MVTRSVRLKVESLPNMDLKAIFELQASLLLFLGTVVLLAHQSSRTRGGNAASRWFFAASVVGSVGLMLQAERGAWPDLFTIVAGNALFMLLIVLLTKSLALTVQASSRSIPYLLVIVAWTAGMLAYNTFWQPDVTRRVFIASVMLPVMLIPSVAMLLRCRQRPILTATRVLAGLYLFFMLSCWLGAVAIFRGAKPQSGANWAGAVLIAGVALCFLWMDLLRMRAELESQAMTDPLTGLLNRRAIEVLAERELSRAARNQSALTLLTIDIDHFKSINDRHGHLVGDRALLGVAAVLRKTLRSHDLAVRTGGDEFIVLLTESSAAIAENIAQRIQSDVATLELNDHSAKRFPISVTVGRYTMRPTVLSAYPDLVHASDMDLYARKQMRSLGGTHGRSAQPAMEAVRNAL